MLASRTSLDVFGQFQEMIFSWKFLAALAGVTFIVWLFFKFRAWFREGDDRTANKLEMLTQFQDLHQQGELSEDEYRLIKSRLTRLPASDESSLLDPLKAAILAEQLVQRRGGNEKNGEAGRNDGESSESRSSDKPPNLKSASRSEWEKDGSGMSPEM